MAKLGNVARKHKLRSRWIEDEARARASYLATRRHLAPFLVPHRFEGDTAPDKLRRSGYGYGIALNRSYLNEILGHIRSTGISTEWGPLASGQPDEDGTPSGGIARDLHSDATGAGTSLRNFMDGEVLEWMLSSMGGFIIVDAPPRPAEVVTKADEQAAGLRPYLRFVPFSAVEDIAPGQHGPRWVKFVECVDNRSPDGEDAGEDEHRVLYRLLEDGSTEVGRYNKDGESVDSTGNPAEPVNLGQIVDTQGRPILPVLPVKRGTHPDVPFLGTGLLYGLDDIVIDLFNVESEMREAYRDAAFALLTHMGPDGEKVDAQMRQGSRLVLLGDYTGAVLQRVAGDSSEVAAGITLVELGVKNWALSAKRQAAEAMGSSGGADSSSGVALSAEFQLDLKPLLVSIAEDLDQLETNVLYVAAQMAGVAEVAADKLSVTRKTDFRLEDEASRIARITKDYTLSLPLTATMKEKLAMKWIEQANVIDLSEMVEVEETPEPVAPEVDEEGNAKPPAPLEEGAPAPEPTMVKRTVGEQIALELKEMAEAEQAQKAAMAFGPGLDPNGAFPGLKLA